MPAKRGSGAVCVCHSLTMLLDKPHSAAFGIPIGSLGWGQSFPGNPELLPRGVFGSSAKIFCCIWLRSAFIVCRKFKGCNCSWLGRNHFLKIYF